jgi:hypothetical protein
MTQLLQVFLVVLFLMGASHSEAKWAPDKIEGATTYIKQYRADWTVKDTTQLIDGTLDKRDVMIVNYGMKAGTTPTSVVATITADDKTNFSVMITGESMLVNGKDVTGNLGSKTTYGSNSPIIEGNQNSQIAAGSQTSVQKDVSSSYTLNISLSVALSVSVALNLYMLWRARRQVRPPPKKTRSSAGAQS